MSALKREIAKHLLPLVAMASIVGCDRVSKHVATEALAGAANRSYFFDVVRLTYAENTGSFLSLGAHLPDAVRFGLFVLASAGLLVGLVAYAIGARWSGAKIVALWLFVGGGTSNLFDRVSDGHVVDFLNVGVGPIRTGIFNVADMAILAGVVILIFGEYWQGRKGRQRASS